MVFLPFLLLLPFLLFLLLSLPPFLLQLALLVEEAEVEVVELVDLHTAVEVVVADKEVAHKVAGVGTVEHKDPWDTAHRLVQGVASFLAGHMMAAVRTWVADYKAVVHMFVHKAVDKAVVDRAVVGKAAFHIVRIAAVHMGVYHIAVEVHTAAVAQTDHMVVVVVHTVVQMAAVGQIYQPFLVVRIVLPFHRYPQASFLALEVELQILCS